MIKITPIARPAAWAIIKELCHDEETTRRIRDHVVRSETYLGVYYRDEALGVFGAARASLIADEGYIWFQHAPGLDRHRIAFARASPQVVDKFFEEFSVLYGVSFSDKSIRWLKWLGAHFNGTSADGQIFVFRRPNG